MKIALDVRSVVSQKTGKEWYTFSLLDELVRLDTYNEYILYTRYDFDLSKFPQNCQKKIIATPMWLWHWVVLWDMWKSKVDIYFATASYIIASCALWKHIRVILTVHDLVAFLSPEKHDLKARVIEKLTARLAFWNADTIICPSLNTQKDLQRLFPSTQGKTIFIPEAARPSFEYFEPIVSTREVILSKYRLPKQYILNIGTLAPRKNLISLLKAYYRLSDELKFTYPLVLIGKKGWYYEEIFETVKKLSLENNVFFVGYVEDFDLPYLLSHATAFVYPSQYEGFGLPLLEAMSCGVPVISSNTGALLEVAKDAAEIVSSTDIDDITRGITQVLSDASYRESLRIAGKKRAAEYSWKKVAEMTYEVMRLDE